MKKIKMLEYAEREEVYPGVEGEKDSIQLKRYNKGVTYEVKDSVASELSGKCEVLS